ncbi:hypothetical protein PTI98_005811 [Pleurotus ostreatus]|nr:hypothetical protein PTI98_005811 [Pleurotus ostreatus]
MAEVVPSLGFKQLITLAFTYLDQERTSVPPASAQCTPTPSSAKLTRTLTIYSLSPMADDLAAQISTPKALYSTSKWVDHSAHIFSYSAPGPER